MLINRSNNKSVGNWSYPTILIWKIRIIYNSKNFDTEINIEYGETIFDLCMTKNTFFRHLRPYLKIKSLWAEILT